MGQLDSQLKAARERSIIDFGDPSLAATAGFGLDPSAAAFAQQNYKAGNSVLSRLDKSHDQMRKAVIDRLAAHGIINSGELGYGTGQADEQYGNQVYDARKQLLDYLNGVTSSDLQGRQQLHQSVIDALRGSYNTFLEHPEVFPAAPPEPPAAKPDPQMPLGPPAYPNNAATIIQRALHGRGL